MYHEIICLYPLLHYYNTATSPTISAHDFFIAGDFDYNMFSGPTAQQLTTATNLSIKNSDVINLITRAYGNAVVGEFGTVLLYRYFRFCLFLFFYFFNYFLQLERNKVPILAQL